jgi:hypothetical protein
MLMQENEGLGAVEQLTRDDQWLDEVLSQTFPASDPVPLRHRETAFPASAAIARSGNESQRST